MRKNSDYVLTKLIDPLSHAKKAQVGVDITLKSIEEITGNPIMINSKINGICYNEVPLIDNVYTLKPHTSYAVTFEQGLKPLNKNEWAGVIQRSSLNRAGIKVYSSIFDPGFFTDNIGTTLYTSQCEFKVSPGDRIAQIYIEDCEDVNNEDLYNGQWQNKANK